MAATPTRRKRLLINPKFQANFAAYALVSTLMMVPLFLGANYYIFNLFAQKVTAMGLTADPELLLFAERQELLMKIVFTIATLIAVVINVISAYAYSNRIAGSMYRLTTEMNRVMDIKTAQTIGYRKEDYFTEVYDAYNHMIERLKT